MPFTSRRKPHSPLAVHINFTANYPPDVCQERLLKLQETPSTWGRLTGAASLRFSFRPISETLWDFHAWKRVGRIEVEAVGDFQKIDRETTAVVGFADCNLSLYVFLTLLMVIGLGVAIRIYNGSRESLCISSALVIASILGVVVNILIVRGRAKDLARTIEETLVASQQD